MSKISEYSEEWQGEDPPVDEDLRHMLQAAATGPNARERESFWGDLERKLDATVPSKHKAKWFALPWHTGRGYLPWAGAACGVLAVLLLLVPTHRPETSQFVESADRAEAPMILGAAPEPESPAVKHKAREAVRAPEFASTPAFSVRWERIPTGYLLYIARTDREAFLQWSQDWPAGVEVRLRPPSEMTPAEQLIYQVEDRR